MGTTPHHAIPVVPIVFTTDEQHLGTDDRALAPDETLGDGIQRILVDAYDELLTALAFPAADADTAIHTARKATKWIRAILLLVRGAIAQDAYRREHAVLRHVARGLSPARDGFMLLTTFQELEDRYGAVVASGLFEPTVTRLRFDHRQQVLAVVDNPVTLARTRDEVAAARRRMQDGAPLRTDDGAPLPDSFSSISMGLRATYHKGRKRHRRSVAGGDDDDALHDWRKPVKHLRHQMEILTPLWPDLIGAQATRLADLGDVLGHDHDLAMLEQRLATDAALCPDPDTAWLIAAAIARERAASQDEAFALGDALYAEPAGAFTRRIAAYWRSARGS